MKPSYLLILLLCILVLITTSVRSEEQHSAKYYNHIGIRYSKNKDFENAIKSFKKAIETDPGYAYAYLNLGFIYKEKLQYDLAIDNFKKALQLNPDFPEAYSSLADIYEKTGDRSQALEYSTKALTIKDSPASIYNLGYTYVLQKDKEAALEQYNKLKEMKQNELADKLLEKINLMPANESN